LFVPAVIIGLAILILKPGVTSETNTASLSDLKEVSKEETIVRQPAVAGSFYPDDKKELGAMIEGFLFNASVPEVSGYPKAIIVPHAGYVYSGQVAAYGFKAISDSFSRVILIGSAHKHPATGISIDSSDVWRTPLGEVSIDTDLRDVLIKESSLFNIDSKPHESEHSLEVEVPFLQTVLSDFKILPLLLNNLSEDEFVVAALSLAKHIDEDTLIVVSTDLSHYPSYEDANYADGKVIKSIVSGDVLSLKGTINSFLKENISNTSTFLCAYPAVELAMRIMERIEASNGKFLSYANSGDVILGDHSRVVGYASLGFFSERKGLGLNHEEQQILLKIARDSLETYLTTGGLPEFYTDSFYLNLRQGAFVTLKKQGQLRGCVGNFEPDIPLYQNVLQTSISAALNDTRFYPVSESELKDLEYEVSVLSPLKRIYDWKLIKAGKHGVRIQRGTRSGVFLPQVASDNNWNEIEFLENLCIQKIGLNKDCYMDKQNELYIFTAQVFGEEEL
jgi:AmmeMemoRadiSam system protein B/AmmeMemoRadiSam system protein A